LFFLVSLNETTVNIKEAVAKKEKKKDVFSRLYGKIDSST